MKLLASCLDSGSLSSFELTSDSISLKSTPPHYSTPDKEGRDLHVQATTTFEYCGNKYVLLGRKGLVLDVLVETERGLMLCKRKRLISGQVRSDFYVDLQVNYEYDSVKNELEAWVRCCTGFGYCYFIRLEKLMDSKFGDFAMSFGMSGFVGFFKMVKFDNDDEKETWKIVYGGKDRGVNLLELKDHCNIWKSKNLKPIVMRRVTKKNDDMDEDDDEGVDESWKELTLEEPLWIQDVLILNDGNDFKDMKILAVTKFGKLLKYYPNLSKYPIDEFQMFDQLSIKNIVELEKNVVLLNTGFNQISLFDVESWKLIKSFNLITGSLSTLKTLKVKIDDTQTAHLLFIGSNIDKMLRTYILFQNQASNDQNKWVLKLLSKQKTDGIVTNMTILEKEILPIEKLKHVIMESNGTQRLQMQDQLQRQGISLDQRQVRRQGVKHNIEEDDEEGRKDGYEETKDNESKRSRLI